MLRRLSDATNESIQIEQDLHLHRLVVGDGKKKYAIFDEAARPKFHQTNILLELLPQKRTVISELFC